MEEKKYEDILSNMRKFRDALKNHEETDLWVLKDEIVTDIEYYFPELKESEDERIRKELVEWLKSKLANPSIGFNPAKMEKWIAYLEKLKDIDKRLEEAYKTADEVQYKRGYEDALAFLNKANEEAIREIGDGMKLPIIGQRKTDGGIIGVMQRQINELSHSLATKKSEQEWTDEDEIMLNGIIDDFGDGKTSNMLQELWLKSIKKRLQ